MNQFFSPPKDIDLLQKKCNKRYKTTYPDNDTTILVSEACPTFCNFDMCCPINWQTIEFIVDEEKKKCRGLLNILLEDETIKGKAMLAEQCDAELPAIGGGFALVKDICTGFCRTGC